MNVKNRSVSTQIPWVENWILGSVDNPDSTGEITTSAQFLAQEEPSWSPLDRGIEEQPGTELVRFLPVPRADPVTQLFEPRSCWEKASLQEC